MAKKRNILDDIEKVAVESEFLELPKPKIAPKKVAPKSTPKSAPKSAPKATPKTAIVSRGAVVKPEPKRGPARQLPPYKPMAKITVIEGARNYRLDGKVYAAVQLMKRHGTVEAYQKAMEKSENDLPAIGLLRYLHKKKAVNVE